MFLKDKTVAPGQEFNLLSLCGTHGGRFYLKDDQEWAELYRLQASDAESNKPQFLVPQRPKHDRFPLTLDLDFVSQQHRLEYLIQTLLPVICRGAANVMCNQPTHLRFILASAAEKQTEFKLAHDAEEKVTGYKTGAHMHFISMMAAGKATFVSVDTDTALRLRESMLVQLYSELGPNQGGCDYEDILDDAVLGGANGFVSALHSSRYCNAAFSAPSVLPC